MRIVLLLVLNVVLAYSSCTIHNNVDDDKPLPRAGGTWYGKQWLARDTAFFIRHIDSLKELDFPELAAEAYNLSEATGFGWTLTDPSDKKYLVKDSDTTYIKENIVMGFSIYRHSKLFMREMNTTLLMHRYFDWQKRLYPADSILVESFVEDIAEGNLCIK